MGTTGKLFFNHNTHQWGTDWYQGLLRRPDVRSHHCTHLSLSSGVFLGSFVAFCRSKHRNARVTDCDEGTREPGAGRGFTQGPHHPRGRFRGLEPWAPDRGGQATRSKAPCGQHWRLGGGERVLQPQASQPPGKATAQPPKSRCNGSGRVRASPRGHTTQASPEEPSAHVSLTSPLPGRPPPSRAPCCEHPSSPARSHQHPRPARVPGPKA